MPIFPTIMAWAKSVANANPGNFATPMGGFSISVGAVEANVQRNARIAGTFRHMGVSVDALSTGRSFRMRINAANGNCVTSHSDGVTSIVYDDSHTDHVAVTDNFDWQYNAVGATSVSYWGLMLFTGDTVTAGYYHGGASGGVASAAMSGALILAAGGQGAASNANSRATIRVPGTAANLHVNVTTASNATVSCTSQKAGVNANLTVSLTSGTTGVFEDTTHSDTLVSGDLYGWNTGAFGTTVPTISVGCTMTYTGNQSDVCGASCSHNFNAANTFGPLVGGIGSRQTTESVLQQQLGVDGTLTRFRTTLVSNTLTSPVLVTVRKNGVSQTNTLSLTNGTTGAFEDTTHTDTFTRSDLMSVLFTGGTANSCTALSTGFTFTNADPVPYNPWPQLAPVFAS